jgi:UPF0755 protein
LSPLSPDPSSHHPGSSSPHASSGGSSFFRRLWVLIFVFLLSSFWIFWPGSGKKWVDVIVPEGSSAFKVSEDLKEKGLIATPYPFLILVKLQRGDQRIHPGLYRFSIGRSAYWIVDDLLMGRTVKARVVIPEGFASWQIAERLEDEKICKADEFLGAVREKKLEGYLFPATYEFDIGLAAGKVANQLVSQFHSKWSSDMEERTLQIGFNKHEIVILASIIEREVRVRDELPMVSAVYHNRLQKKMKLDADPTVQYALGFWKPRLTYNDYRDTRSPYNTYLVNGLPPGPICSPGLDALKAALWPAQTNDLFFVATEDGRHSFSATYREHTNKVNRRNRKKR